MAGALDQSPGLIQKPIRHPLQRYAPVRAAILIDRYLRTLAHHNEVVAIVLYALAAACG